MNSISKNLHGHDRKLVNLYNYTHDTCELFLKINM